MEDLEALPCEKRFKNQFKRKGSRSYKSPPKIHVDTLEIAVLEAGIDNYLLINDESGLWVLFKKQQNYTI